MYTEIPTGKNLKMNGFKWTPLVHKREWKVAHALTCYVNLYKYCNESWEMVSRTRTYFELIRFCLNWWSNHIFSLSLSTVLKIDARPRAVLTTPKTRNNTIHDKALISRMIHRHGKDYIVSGYLAPLRLMTGYSGSNSLKLTPTTKENLT